MLLDELDEQIDGLDCRIYDKLIHFIEKESFNPYLSIELMNTLISLGISEINVLMNKRRELNNSKQKAISECVAQFKKLEESEPMKDLMSVFTRKTDGRRGNGFMEVKNKIMISNIYLELTRACNLSCPHCLRGNADNDSFMTFEQIDRILDNFTICHHITMAVVSRV